MGIITPFKQEKFIVGVLSSRDEKIPEVTTLLEEAYGPVDYASVPLPFTFTDYYNPEMGEQIARRFFSFRDLRSPGELSDIKINTNELEKRWMEEPGGKRKINLDPGFLNASRLILASTKAAPHRIPLKEGIYAEVTLRYIRGAFAELPWTYPDFRSGEYAEILTRIRIIYLGQLKRGG